MAKPSISEELRLGRRALEGLPGVQILQDWNWDKSHNCWYLYCRITIEKASKDDFPSTTDWYILVDTNYPVGNISFYPAKKNGITQTFTHQSYNGYGNEDIPWRQGKICLETPLHRYPVINEYFEPNLPQERLLWYFQRAIEWLNAAYEGNLTKAGDPYELPDFPFSDLEIKFAFSEDTESYVKWKSIPDITGFVDLIYLPDTPFYVAKNLYSRKRVPLINYSWGNILDNHDILSNNIWIRIKETPVLNPWQPPKNWGKLRQVFQSQSIDLNNILCSIVKELRDNRRHLLLVGFEIPEKIGGSSNRIHWQAIVLPVLSAGDKVLDGFRKNEQGYWHRDRMLLLSNGTDLDWILSENWNYKEISNRGQVNTNITNKAVLIIGAGALGSSIAELFVRTGFLDITIIDDDKINIGNLVRHTLTIDSIKKLKADSLAKHLNMISPHAKVNYIKYAFPPVEQNQCDQINNNQIIVDCTGNDEVLNGMESFNWNTTKLFFSISFNLFAQRLYCFNMLSKHFSKNAFDELLKKWRQEDSEKYKSYTLPMEGVGCWHPVFPARSDDIWLLASTGFKYIINCIEFKSVDTQMAVFEQDKTSLGIKRIA
jgi:molybdopterin/thiamine biosynthesis adenylyltransferase